MVCLTGEPAVFRLDAETGDVVWRVDVEGPGIGSLASAGDSIYVSQHGQDGVELATTDGKVRRQFDHSLGEVTATENHLYAGSTALAATDGRLQWRYETAGYVDHCHRDGTVYVAAADGVYALEQTDVPTRAFLGEVTDVGDRSSTLHLQADDGGVQGGLTLSNATVPYYGCYEGARFDVVIEVHGTDWFVADEYREEPRIRSYVGDVTRTQDGETTIEFDTGDTAERLTVPTGAFGDIDTGDSVRVAVSLEYDEDSTPVDGKPDPVELWNRYSG